MTMLTVGPDEGPIPSSFSFVINLVKSTHSTAIGKHQASTFNISVPEPKLSAHHPPVAASLAYANSCAPNGTHARGLNRARVRAGLLKICETGSPLYAFDEGIDFEIFTVSGTPVGTALPGTHQPFSHHPQVRQGEQRGLLRDVFRQTTKAHFRITKLALDHAKRVLNRGPHLRFRVFDLAAHAPDQALFSVLFITAGPGGNRPDHLAPFMFGTLVYTGVTGIARDVRFLTMEQLNV
jgi:hypothetical protein